MNNLQLTLYNAALALAKRGIPSFPTDNKKPCWSNRELGVTKGNGGYKIASTDPKELAQLFDHRFATELAVPMGEMSGMICVDVDHYKLPALKHWVTNNWSHLKNTLTHTTRSGGQHFIFQHPGNDIRYPATLRTGVDLKSNGNGYICFPPTEGYEVQRKGKLKKFPMKLLEQAMKEKGGSGSVTLGSAYNEQTNDELVEAIRLGTDFYPALRTLSARLARQDLEPDQMCEILRNIMFASEGMHPDNDRHEDWQDRLTKIPELVASAIIYVGTPPMNEAQALAYSKVKSFVTLPIVSDAVDDGLPGFTHDEVKAFLRSTR